jgi:signal transduction histidine kinase
MTAIYEPLTEGVSARTGGGAGLGLLILKRLMTSLGGNLSLSSLPGSWATAVWTVLERKYIFQRLSGPGCVAFLQHIG